MKTPNLSSCFLKILRILNLTQWGLVTKKTNHMLCWVLNRVGVNWALYWSSLLKKIYVTFFNLRDCMRPSTSFYLHKDLKGQKCRVLNNETNASCWWQWEMHKNTALTTLLKNTNFQFISLLAVNSDAFYEKFNFSVKVDNRLNYTHTGTPVCILWICGE